MEEQQALTQSVENILSSPKSLTETVKETAVAQKQLISLADKNAELQRELTAKQQELIANEKEIISLHRQIMRGQRADAKRLVAVPKKLAEADADKNADSSLLENAEAQTVSLNQ